MRVETNLMLNENEAGSVVEEDTPSGVHVVEFRFVLQTKWSTEMH
jgi:hypothetical protein